MSKVCPSSRILPPVGNLAESVEVLFVHSAGLARALLGGEMFFGVCKEPFSPEDFIQNWAGAGTAFTMPHIPFPCLTFCSFWPR